jgi:hypothetical protein
MEPLDYETLDPGIRMTVRLLRSSGFETTDSGDGRSKSRARFASGEALPFAHVVVKAEPSSMAATAEVVQWLLGPKWEVEASYSTVDQRAILFCRLRVE